MDKPKGNRVRVAEARTGPEYKHQTSESKPDSQGQHDIVSAELQAPSPKRQRATYSSYPVLRARVRRSAGEWISVGSGPRITEERVRTTSSVLLAQLPASQARYLSGDGPLQACRQPEEPTPGRIPGPPWASLCFLVWFRER